ncbi:MAG: hypothetical protein IJU37_05230 [Desulfovibrio sp.]|nr:hypothetical protein [Desulfovibrio sp.]
MLSSKDLNALGIPNAKAIMPLAMRLVNVALAKGADEETMRGNLRALALTPASMTGVPTLWQEAGYLKSDAWMVPKF